MNVKKKHFDVVDQETKEIDIEAMAKTLSSIEDEEEQARFRMMEAGISAEFARIFGVKKAKA